MLCLKDSPDCLNKIKNFTIWLSKWLIYKEKLKKFTKEK